MALSPKQKLFVQEYLVDLNASAAALRAGYSPKTAHVTGHETLKKPEVQLAITKALELREKRTNITQDWVLTSLKSVAERCMQAEAVFDREGNPTGEYKFDSSGANRSLELIGKHLKMFTEKHELTGKDSGPVSVAASGAVEVSLGPGVLATLGALATAVTGGAYRDAPLDGKE